jgi:hypothetical protein
MKIKEADVYTVQHEDEGDDDEQNP